VDDLLTPCVDSALAELASSLGMEPPGGDLRSFLRKAAARASELAESERRSRQAVGTYRAASGALVQNLDPRLVLEDLLDYLNWMVPYDAASVLFKGRRGVLESAAAREWRPESSDNSDARSIAAAARRAIARTEPQLAGDSRERLLAVPLPGVDGNEGAAVLVRSGDQNFGEEEIRAAETFAEQAAAVMRNAQLIERLTKADEELVASYDATIEALSRALELKDHETEGHTLRVAQSALGLAEAFGMPKEERACLRRGALLHDIGKIGIPDSILLKPGPLDPAERAIMERHPVYAYELLSAIPFLARSLDIPYCHHERWDGSGYPRGLRGESIPPAARLFAVVDVWDALVSDRPYRRALDRGEARDIIAAGSATSFDPAIVELFLLVGLD